MKNTLVIVESPTKAKTIKKFLGSGYMVESSLGHVRDLPKSKMGVDIENGTFEPTYKVSKDKTKHVKKLKDLAKKADSIIFATDEDREGEAISWHLAHILDIKPDKAKRIVFHEITKHAIDEALKNPRHIDQKLVDAQQARRILDRLVGYELSPLLWKKIAVGLSAGRVQSIAVRLVVDRERERQAFVSDEYWTLDALFHKAHDFVGKLYAEDDKKIDKLNIETEADMQTILDNLKSATYTVKKIIKKETKRNPPPPFTTSTLQQKASNKLGYSAKQTMRLAQQLYEGMDIGEHGTVGLITYMRTDSQNLSDKFIDEANDFINAQYGKEYTLDTPRKFKTKSKGAQEAHEAIRPTHADKTPDMLEQYLTPQQYKLYSLIWKRAMATQMAQARLNKTTIDITADKYTFRVNGQSMLFPGWLKLYPTAVKEEMLPELKEGEELNCKELKPEQHFTEPPARYSDATLIKVLEEHGIGRPSTYAPTISTIETRNYVSRDDNKRLYPEDIAFVVNDMLVEHFPDIVDYGFTAQMEDNLDDIAEGKKDWKPIISTFYHPFHKTIQEKTDELSKEDMVGMRHIGDDPETAKPIYVRVGRYGPFVQKGSKDDEKKPQFAKLAKGQSIETITLDEALHLLQLPRDMGEDPYGNNMEVNIGRFGPYVKYGNKFVSLDELDPYNITKDEALKLVAEHKKKEAEKMIQTWPDSSVQVLNGRYGPYITNTATKVNAKIPKNKEPKELTLEECLDLLENAPTKRFRGKKKSGNTKKKK